MMGFSIPMLELLRKFSPIGILRAYWEKDKCDCPKTYTTLIHPLWLKMGHPDIDLSRR
jgi:hypothetical protein